MRKAGPTRPTAHCNAHDVVTAAGQCAPRCPTSPNVASETLPSGLTLKCVMLQCASDMRSHASGGSCSARHTK